MPCRYPSSVSRRDLAFSMSIYHWLEVYADVIVQYVLTATVPSTSTMLPCRLRSLATTNLLGHLAWWGIRSSFLRPI